MKILRILPAMDFGGIERGVRDFSLKAAEWGHKIVVAAQYGRFAEDLQEKGIKYWDIPLNTKNPLRFKNLAGIIKNIISCENPDIIHAQSRFPCWIVYSVMRSFPEKPWVTSLHSFNKFKFYSRSEGMGNLVITVSNALKKHAEEYFGVSGNNIRVVYNGISGEFAEIKKRSNKITCIGMIGRFSFYKGHYYFLEALKELIENYAEINGIIVGSGGEGRKNALAKWILKNQLENKIKIVHADAKKALEDIDILIVPSFKPEGFGRTVVEAQMSGTPVIGTSIGAIPELIEDGKTGFLVEPKNSGQIAEKIKYIIQNPNLAQEIVDNARQNAINNFTVDKMTKNILRVYKELV